MDLKWQLVMLFVRINRFEKKAGKKLQFDRRDAARLDNQEHPRQR